MIDLTADELNGLAPTYLVANTPAYLYRDYRRHQTVQRFAETLSAEELVDTIRVVESAPGRRLKDVVAAYAAAVALTLKDSREAEAMIADLRVSHLLWVPHIFAIWRQSRSGLSRTRLQYPASLQEDATRSRSTSSDTRLIFEGGA